MKYLYREPLLHFFVIGALIFVAFALLDDTPSPVPADRIEITEADVVQLIRRYEAQWRRQPTEAELAGLLDRYVQEEILVREALALGLDRDDAIVRQRLAQKMTFLTESGAETLQPSEDELQAHLASHRERFGKPGRISFEQVIMQPDAPVEAIRAALREGEVLEEFRGTTLLPTRLPPSPKNIVDGTFGRGFFDAVIALEKDKWAGPVKSTYGLHLVRVLSSEPPRLPPLSEIRDTVESDWRATMREQLAKQRLDALMSRYEIIRPDPKAVLE
jgi:hypothetical protein